MRDVIKEMFFDAQELLARGAFAQAIKAYEKALSHSENESDEEYMSHLYLAMAYDDAGKTALAVKSFQNAQKSALIVFGKESIPYATALSNEAMMYSNARNPAAAEALLDTAIAILRKQSLPKKSSPEAASFAVSVMEVYANAADCKAKMGNAPLAIELMTKSYDIANALLEPNHPRRIQASIELSGLMSALGMDAEAEKMRDEIFDNFHDANLDPLQALSLFMNGCMNASAMIDGIDGSAQKNKPKSKKAKPANSNVVPLKKSKDGLDETVEGGVQLKIVLKGVKPPIWRRVTANRNSPLSTVHQLIQDAMGWTNSHSHMFEVRGQTYGDPTHMNRDERDFSISSLLLDVGDKFEYEYDFGDSWHHSVEVEKYLTTEEFAASKIFVTGKGACPPEDCGGVYAFMMLLNALENGQELPEHLEEMLEDFDPAQLPECFDSGKKKSTQRKPTKKSVKSRS